MGISRRSVVKGAVASAGLAAVGAPGLLLAQSQPLKIGVMYGLSGANSVNGDTMLKGTQIAAAQYNKAGGVLGRQIELVVRDDKYSGAGAVAAARELQGDGINLMIGGSQTIPALGLLPLLADLKVVLVIPGAGALAITHEAFSRNAFRLVSNSYFSNLSLAKAMSEKFPNIVKWQPVVPDNTFGRDAGHIFTTGLKQYHPKRGSKDFEVKEMMLVGATQTDFRAQMNTLANSGVQGVFTALVGASEISLFQQMRAVGLDKKITVVELIGDLVAKTLGKDMPASFWGLSFWPYQSDLLKNNKISQQLYKDYVAMTHDPYPAGLMNLGYKAGQALFEGIKKAKSTDTEAVIKAMEGLTFDSATGPYRLRKEDHQGLGNTYICNYVASPKEPYFQVKEVIAVSEESVVESPSPGAEYVI